MKKTGLLALLLLSSTVTAQAGHGTIRETETQIFVEYYGDADDNKIANLGPYGPAEQPSSQQVIRAVRPKAGVAVATVKPATKPNLSPNETPYSTPIATPDSNPDSNPIAASYSTPDSNPVATPYSNPYSNPIATSNATPRPNQGVQTAQAQVSAAPASSPLGAQGWGNDSGQNNKNQRPPRPGRLPRKGYSPPGLSLNPE